MSGHATLLDEIDKKDEKIEELEYRIKELEEIVCFYNRNSADDDFNDFISADKDEQIVTVKRAREYMNKYGEKK